MTPAPATPARTRVAGAVGSVPLGAVGWEAYEQMKVPAPSGSAAQPRCVPATALEGVASLGDKSLVQPAAPVEGIPGFGMLETIRAYAWKRLLASEDGAGVRRAHALYYLEFVETAEPELMRREQRQWLARLEAEHDNLWAALRWAQEHGEGAIGLRLCGALALFWFTHTAAGPIAGSFLPR